MAEVVGLAASIIALIQLTGKLTAITYGYISGVKRAPKDIAELLNELSSLGKQLIILKDYIDRYPNSAAVKVLNAKDGPIQICLDDLKALESMLETESLKGMVGRLKWPIREKDTLSYISRIERQKSLIIFAITTDNLSVSKEIGRFVKDTDLAVRSLQDIATTQEASNLTEKRAKVLNWLYTGDPSTKHLEITNRRQPGTGRWLLMTPEFQKQLKKHPDHQMLWGHGIPGAGKTFLSSVVIDYLEEEAVTKNYGVAYIYFEYQDREKQTPLRVLGSLVKQLSTQLDDLPTDIEDLHDTLVAKGKQAKFEELYGAFLVALKSFTRVFLVFDALDECDPYSQRKDLFPLFHRMGRDGASLFVTSRQYPEDIQKSFQAWSKIELSAQKEDIEIYVQQRINDSPRASRLVEQARCQGRIIAELIDCAQGMFLVVYFHIEYLCQQTTAKQLLTALAKLRSASAGAGPLESAYDRCIERIHSQLESCAQLGKMILLWLVKAQRVLTVDELRVAVSIEPNRYELDEMDLPDKATVLDVCAGLVTVDGDSHIRLTHFTVQEYLLRRSVIPEQSNNIAAVACTTYVSFKAFAQGPCTSYESFQVRLKTYPFLDYASRYLSYHIKASDQNLLTHACLKFLESPGNMGSAVQVFRNYEEKFGGWVSPESYQRICVPLYIASYIGHVNIVRRLLQEGASLSVTDDHGQTTLQIAASGGSTDVIQVLLENGVDIEERSVEGTTALHVAVAGGHIEAVELLLDKGANVSSLDLKNTTPLLIAAHRGYEDLVQLLLKEGAEASMASTEGTTPLLAAAYQGHEKVVQILLEKGPHLSFQDSSGSTALHHAAFGGDRTVVQLLLDKGADLSARNIHQRTAFLTAVANGHDKVVHQLLINGADISDRDQVGNTCVHLAAYQGHEVLIQTLLDNGADIMALNESGYTPLHSAAFGGHRIAAELLIAKGLDISTQEKGGNTALHLGAWEGQESIVCMLLEKGANTSTRNNDGGTALQLAVRQGHQRVVEELLDHGVDISESNNNDSTALHFAALAGSDILMRLLLEKGASLSTINKFGNNALHLAAQSGNVASVKMLLDKGIEHPLQNKTGLTALNFAAIGGNETVIQLLLDKDGEFLVKDHNGDTPLHYAAVKGHKGVAQLLIEKGSDPSGRNDVGITALHYAGTGGHTHIVQLLLQEGAEISAKNNVGNTALHCAALCGFSTVVQLLLDGGADALAKNNDGETALQYATQAGKIDVVNLLDIALGGVVKSKAVSWWQDSMFIRLYDNRFTPTIFGSVLCLLSSLFLYAFWSSF